MSATRRADAADATAAREKSGAEREARIFADDASFDRVYPDAIRLASRRFWTPVAIARRAAELLREAGARRVLDVGSGVGKFALVAAAANPGLRFFGIEHRAHLVAAAERAKAELRIANVRFAVGDVTDASWKDFDGFYFFNPFAENIFDAVDRLDNRIDLSMERFARNVLRAEIALRAAPLGTAVVTYHGSSGRMPACFELAHVERSGSDWLRLWSKTHETDDGSFFIEMEDSIARRSAEERAPPERGGA